jgi:hypothetical protein
MMHFRSMTLAAALIAPIPATPNIIQLDYSGLANGIRPTYDPNT